MTNAPFYWKSRLALRQGFAFVALSAILLSVAALVHRGTPDYAEAERITVRSSGCYGSCPAYDLTIDSNGEVRFNGKNFTRQCGEAAGHVDPSVFRHLVGRMKDIGFLSILVTSPDTFDAPTVNLSLQVAAKTLRVENSFDQKHFKELSAVENEVVEQSGATQWIEGCKQTTNTCGCPEGSFGR